MQTSLNYIKTKDKLSLFSDRSLYRGQKFGGAKLPIVPAGKAFVAVSDEAIAEVVHDTQ